MNSTVEQIALVAPDISCGHCEATVQGAVCALTGVQSVTASAETKLVEIAFDPSKVPRPQIEAVLDDAGYPVTK
jgi:copper chaperone